MKVNFYVEDMLFFRYIGCATVARTLYRHLQGFPDIDVSWKSFANSSDIVHFHTFGPLAGLNRRLARGKTILTAHSTPRVNMDNIALARAINKRYPHIYRRFDHIITISRPCHEEVTSMVPDMPVTMIPNGVDREFFQRDGEKGAAFREDYHIPPDQKVVLTVAQQTPRKGLYDFLALSRVCPDTTFVWIGGFPYGALSKDYGKIKKMKVRCGSNVIFPGHINDIIRPYSAADVFFMPSYAETFGLVILEALSCGLPVIARDIPEFRDIYGDSILYFRERSDVPALLEDTAQLDRCARHAREFSARFDIRDIAAQHVRLYRELAE
ncbi:MAG: glycosyltransferase family 4 protein [Methanolinea sp.]|nr:glycosyltransferase family 4 protein [Methanolinea sp.]